MIHKLVAPYHYDALKGCSFLTSLGYNVAILGTALLTDCTDCNINATALRRCRGYSDTPTFYDISFYNERLLKHILF